MEWVILFIASWIIFLLLVDWKSIKVNVWSGFIAALMQLFIDTQFIFHELYKINQPIVHIWGSSVFFVAGPVFVIGVLLAQYSPKKRWALILHALVLSSLYSLQESLILSRRALEYINWHYSDSLAVNFIVLSSLCWFSIVVLKKGAKI